MKRHPALGAALAAMMVWQGVAPGAALAQAQPKTPIEHVIIIIGENRTFDHVFATYVSKSGDSVDNLLSKGIIKADGTPGPNFALAMQNSASDTNADGFQLAPGGKAPYATLPPPLNGGPKDAFFPSVAAAKSIETDLPDDYYVYLTTGGTGQTGAVPDARIPNATNLPPGPFQLTSATLPYDSYTASPVHRFYQMWQQFDCSAANASTANPSGCAADLFPWVEVTVGAGSNGKPQPANFDLTSTREGGTAMGFYNVQQGDAPFLKFLADHFTMSDNFHQSVMGGTGANHVMLGTGDAIWFSDGSGNAAVPPHNQPVAAGSPNAGTVDEIEDPTPQAGPNNFYTQDGYGGGSYGSASYGGGTYSNCSDPTAPGVGPVVSYLGSLARPISPNCEPGHYYLLNNYNPGYYGDGRNAYADIGNPNETVFTIPPSTLKTIGDSLNAAQLSWAYYGGQFNAYRANPDGNYVTPDNTYCGICNPFQYVTSIMTDPAQREAHLKDTTDFYKSVAGGNLPAVSFIKPDGFLDGHPASSKLNLFEGFVKKVIYAVLTSPQLWKNTAIFVTFDEGGGYYDSGYIQPLDFFGDGTRIPLIVVSHYTRGGHISHSYSDHVSLLKFIEANWGLKPVTSRSRDNFPNPKVNSSNPYVPLNSPALDDLMDIFNFNQ
jgi:phospholipase C